ncbi:MAG: hypothetical protein MZV65_22510 [Chromatiales bacterium]|nr:hypothetical protein [Chromatiales bacterium]
MLELKWGSEPTRSLETALESLPTAFRFEQIYAPEGETQMKLFIKRVDDDLLPDTCLSVSISHLRLIKNSKR